MQRPLRTIGLHVQPLQGNLPGSDQDLPGHPLISPLAAPIKKGHLPMPPRPKQWKFVVAALAALAAFAMTTPVILAAAYLLNAILSGKRQDFFDLAKAWMPAAAGVATILAVVVALYANQLLEQFKGEIAGGLKDSEQDRGTRIRNAEQLRL